MRVIPDHTQSEWNEQHDGIKAVRAFSVHDLDGVSSGIIKAAVNAPGVPALEEAHPDEPGIVVIDKTGSPMHDRSVLVRCSYAVPTWDNAPGLVPQLLELDSSVLTEKTYYDINGVRLSATYTGTVIVTHYPSTEKTLNIVTATIRKVETTSDADLLARSVAYNDSVNDAAWFGWPAKTWRLEDLQVRQSRFAGKREVTYVLSYKPDTWQFLATYIESGRVPPDATEGNGFRRWDIRDLTDFSGLPITVPTMPP